MPVTDGLDMPAAAEADRPGGGAIAYRPVTHHDPQRAHTVQAQVGVGVGVGAGPQHGVLGSMSVGTAWLVAGLWQTCWQYELPPKVTQFW